MVARDRACDCERQRMPSLRLHSVALSEPSSSGALARCFQRRKVANQNHPRVRGPPVDTTRRIPTRSVRESRAAVTQIGGNRYSDERVYYRIPGISITSRSSTRRPLREFESCVVYRYLRLPSSTMRSLDPRLHLQHVRIRCLQHTCGTINIIILPCGNIRACARRRQGQRRLERPYPSLSVDSRCRAAAPSRSRHTNSLPGAVIRSHPRCTAAQSGSYCCPKWKFGASLRRGWRAPISTRFRSGKEP